MESQTNDNTDKLESKEVSQCKHIEEKHEVISSPPIPATPVSECRRSSRKKIIKFDVRDLLNKNRKPHKIQIEARIDSNAPNTNTKAAGVTVSNETDSSPSTLNTAVNPDLSSKQKVFMEKSAIFRRFSVSQEQTKPPPPPPLPLPPTILSKVCDNSEAGGPLTVSGKRLNRSQEYYKNALLKPKQTTSLIVAQVESNVRSVDTKAQSLLPLDTTPTRIEQPYQKKRGRPPKARLNESGKKSPNTTSTETVTETPLSPEKATNWREYKACLAEQHNKNIEKSPEKLEELQENLVFLSADIKKEVENVVNLDCMPENSSITVENDLEEGLKRRNLSSKNDELDLMPKCRDVEISEQDVPAKGIAIIESTDTSITKEVEESLISCEIIQQHISSKYECNVQTEERKSYKKEDDIKSPSEEKMQIVDAVKRSERLKQKSGDKIHKQHIKEYNSRSRSKLLKQNTEDYLQEDDEKSSETSVENSCSDTLSVSDTPQDSMDHEKKQEQHVACEENKTLDSPREKKTKNKQNTQQRKSLRKQNKCNKEDEKNLMQSSKNSDIIKEEIKAVDIMKSFDVKAYQEHTKEVNSSVLTNETSSSQGSSNETVDVLLYPDNIKDNGNQIACKDFPLETKSDSKTVQNQIEESKNILGEYNIKNSVKEDETISNYLKAESMENTKSPNEKEKIKDLCSKQDEFIQQIESLSNKVEDEPDLTNVTTVESILLEMTENETNKTINKNEDTTVCLNNSITNVDTTLLLQLKDLQKGHQVNIVKTYEKENQKEENLSVNLEEETISGKIELKDAASLISGPSNQALKSKVQQEHESDVLSQTNLNTKSIADSSLRQQTERMKKYTEVTTTLTTVTEDSENQKQILSDENTTSIIGNETEEKRKKNLSDETSTTDSFKGNQQKEGENSKNKTKSSTKRKSLRKQNNTSEKSLETTKTETTEGVSEVHVNKKEESITELKTSENNLTTNDEKMVNCDESRAVGASTPLSEYSQTSLDETPSTSVTSMKKKQTRKSRFKNLHNSDSDPDNISKPSSGAEAKNNKQDEPCMFVNYDRDDKQQSPSEVKISSDIEELQNKKIINTASSQTETSNSYVIKNLSIETNTLLDILRTVQSNEEAAVEAKKLCDPPIVERQDSEESSESSSIKNVKSRKTLSECISSSPCRSASGSPLTTSSKKVISSPCISETSSSSPLTVSRSNTSSPLSLNKKKTRSLERRSRGRGDESTHKTLEETFAEIAALSSKAVLELSNVVEENKEHFENTQEDDVTIIIKDISIDNSSKKETNDDDNLKPQNENKPYADDEIKPIMESPATIDAIRFDEQNSDKSVELKDLNDIGLEMKDIIPLQEIQENKKSEQQKEDHLKAEENIVSIEEFSTSLDSNTTEELGTLTPKCDAKSKPNSTGSNNKSESKSSNKKSSKKIKNSDPETNIKTQTPKRGRKAKLTATNEVQVSPVASSNNKEKKKLKKEQTDIAESSIIETNKEIEIKSDIVADKVLDEERLTKKSRQRKLKEAFEAALADKNPMDTTNLSPPASPTFESLMNNCQSPTDSTTNTKIFENTNEIEDKKLVLPQEPEEDPDPLKDIEKFIEDGVNLLKKAYKIDEDSVDNVIITNETNMQQNEECDESSIKKDLMAENFETPADTPLATPSVTPPPKSPEHQVICQSDENSSGGVRRSHRLKLITKAPKALVGRGLVKDKERFSIKDDVETKTHYTLDDHLLDLAEVEAKNAKFLKEMEERLSNFQVIKENEYQCERVISREARKMICDCFLTAEEEERGELGCGEDCLNRLLMIECGPECNVRERCTNKRFQKLLCSPCRVFRTEKKGFGIMADIEILPGEFIMEYVGEVIDTEEFERRRIAYSQDKNRHYYFMALRSDAIIDATIKGNISRFINHSCDPNAETQKWTVNGELRIGFFSRKSIMPGEEITFNYQYQRYGREAQRCYCESSNCRGWIGQEPTSDEGEQIDDDDDDESDEEEDEDNTNLLEDDDDSDASVSDPEMVQKKLELAAAQAAVELAPLNLIGPKTKKDAEASGKVKDEESGKTETEEEDSKSKFKKLLSKMAEKVAAKQKQSKREQKLQRKKKSKEISTELLVNKQRSLEDPDIEDEVEFLSRCGLKNQSDTLRLSRLMVRAKLVQTRLNLLAILRKGELPCRRLFLDYHGLRLVHGWMSEDAGNMEIRLALLQTLETLPIANKTVLTDSKVMQVVKSWCGTTKNELSPNEDSQSSNSNSQDGSVTERNTSAKTENIVTESNELQKLAMKLAATWDGLPEIFRIPKKERIEQMKEHEREADRQYAETERNRQSTTDRFSKRVSSSTTKRFNKPHSSKSQITSAGNAMMMRTPGGNLGVENSNYISKAQRRELFAAKVARDEAEKRLAEERREFETKCRFFGLDPKKTRLQDMPFCVNPATGQWYSVERKPITTPPSYAHVQVPERQKSTNPVDYQLPAICATLPPEWKYAITPTGQIYYYHVQYRIPQWEPPSEAQLKDSELNNDDDDSGNEQTPTTGPESSDDDDTVLVGMDAAQLKAYIERKVEARRQKRYQRLVDERAISPRREEDRIYNQVEVRKYKENKEKIRKRKEEIRRKRAEALRHSSLNLSGSLNTESNTSNTSILIKDNENEEEDTLGVLPIQDYLLSSDEDEEDIKIEVNSPLINKIVEGDKIVDELDALTTKRQLKRPLPPHRDISEASPSTSSAASILNLITTASERQDYKKRKMEKKDKRKSKEQDLKYRKTKEKFRCEIAGIIVHHLKPYRKETCTRGRIQSNEDFNHLARKLTHFVMIKELKYCESVGQTLVVTESVKNKSREFIKKYMTKYGDVYVKPLNDPEFKDIPFTL